ncbi:MAG: M14 family zinc carboxypeptidase, partial [Myxococcota bacterium]|nr:M14 family zinc carboxypeptidase [Myxococcota bacterium]
WVRSTLRPPTPGTVRSGLEPRDLTGDGPIRQMRWRHPAGPFVCHESDPLQMRRRTLDDAPEDAWFVCAEGELIAWDGTRWTQAALKHGLDLNRNFPGAWKPFSMFGMDGGQFPISEPESRAVVDAFSARPHIGAAVTNHTYTGALLMAPHRPDDELPQGDLRLLSRLARDAVEGTGYRVLSIHPDFTYDPTNPIVGVWDDTISSVFGVAAYTLELWDPFAHAGLENPDPAKFWTDPDPETVRELTAAFSEEPGGLSAWRPFDHPQLGPVEIGGLDLTRTIHNPPTRLLQAECARGLAVFERVRRSLPRVVVNVQVDTPQPGTSLVRLTLENQGFLSTSSLAYGETIAASPPVTATLETGAGISLLNGAGERELTHMDGWGSAQVSGAANTLYARLPNRGHRVVAEWVVQGQGSLKLSWQAGRAGRGVEALQIGS